MTRNAERVREYRKNNPEYREKEKKRQKIARLRRTLRIIDDRVELNK